MCKRIKSKGHSLERLRVSLKSDVKTWKSFSLQVLSQVSGEYTVLFVISTFYFNYFSSIVSNNG